MLCMCLSLGLGLFSLLSQNGGDSHAIIPVQWNKTREDLQISHHNFSSNRQSVNINYPQILLWYSESLVLWQRACCPTPVAWHLCFTGGKDIGNQVWLCVCSQQWLASPSKFLCHWAGLSGLLPWEHSFSWAPCGGQWRGAGKWAQVPVMDRAPSWEAGVLAYNLSGIYYTFSIFSFYSLCYGYPFLSSSAMYVLYWSFLFDCLATFTTSDGLKKPGVFQVMWPFLLLESVPCFFLFFFF